MQKRYFLITLLTSVYLLSPSVLAVSSSDIHVEVLPLDCLYDTVNTGSGTVTNLMPQECEAAEPLPRPEPHQPIIDPTDEQVVLIPSVPTETLLIDTPDPSQGLVRSGHVEPEAKHAAATPFSDFTRAGQVVMQNPGYTSIGAAASVPIIFAADTFVWNGRVRGMLSKLAKLLGLIK